MRSTLGIASSLLAIATLATPATAQHHASAPQHNNAQPHYNGVPQHNFPGGNQGNFGYNGINFPYAGITFPNNGFNFPNNSNFNFPTYVSNFNLNTANSVGSYQNGTGFYGNYVAAGKQKQFTGVNATNVSGVVAGLNSIKTAPTQHYNYNYRPVYYPRTHTVYHTVRTYQPRNTGPQISQAERHFNAMVQDLDTLAPQFQAVAYHKNMIRNDILALVDGKDRPPTATVQQLANHLTESMVARMSQPIDTAAIAANLRSLVNGGTYTKDELSETIHSTEAVLREGGIASAGIKSISADMNAVAGHFASFSAPANNNNSVAAKIVDTKIADDAKPTTVKATGDILDTLKDKSIIPPSSNK